MFVGVCNAGRGGYIHVIQLLRAVLTAVNGRVIGDHRPRRH